MTRAHPRQLLMAAILYAGCVGAYERRRAVGLPPLSEYAKLFKEVCASPYMALHSASNPERTVAIPQESK